jgi:RHS repeat-associated protein
MTNQTIVKLTKPSKFFGPVPQQKAQTPDEAKKYRAKRKMPADAVRIGSALQTFGSVAANPLASYIADKARALRYDVDLIYEYVHDNIEFIPTYGLHKGGLGAMIDGSGNAFDQADLMVKLLRESGYIAQYVQGNIRLTSAQWSSLLGADSSNVLLASNMLSNGGIGISGIIGSDLVFEHCWVKVIIGGTAYYFDPAMKSYTDVTGVNLATALNYTGSTFLTDAKSGYTLNAGNSVKNINAANINTDLTNYTTNLVQFIKQNNPGASFDQILGGRTINPTTGTVRNTTLSYQNGSAAENDAIPDTDRCTFQFVYDPKSDGGYNINVFGYTDELFGARLMLFWDSTGHAGFYNNGTQAGPSSAVKTAGVFENAFIQIKHPYALVVNGVDQNTLWFSEAIQGRAPTLIGMAYGVTSKDLAGIHQEYQNDVIAAGFTDSTEPLLGTSLQLIWDNFIAQSSMTADILKRLGNAEIVLHHFVGTIAQSTKPGTTSKIKSISSFLSAWSTSPRANSVDLTSTNFALSLFVQALEGTASEQVTGVEAADAIKMVSICNQAGTEILDATSANWSSGFDVNSKLGTAGWNAALITDIHNEVLDKGRVVIPNNPLITIGSFTDFHGYIGVQGASTYSTTWFGNKGAASAGAQDDAGTNAAASDNARQVNGFGMPAVTATESARVNMLNGRYEYSSTDLSVGNQGAPYELSFVRSYNSGSRLALATSSSADHGLGFGWTHNWLMKATVNSDGFICLGDQQVSAAAAAIATLYVMRDVTLSNSALPIENFVIQCEVARFLVKQFAKNTVRIQAGGGTLSFLKMPNGTYMPPMGSHGKSLLEAKGSSSAQYYQYTTPDGVVYKYKTSGEIETITYPYGIVITFTYTSGRLSKVSNGTRNLNFVYDSFGQLRSVNDGNGRTITLTIPSSGADSGNLTNVTDPLGNTTVYTYNGAGRLVGIVRPANPSSPVSTVDYDARGRVTQQTDSYGNIWQFFFADTRTEELAPNNTKRVLYFNKSGSVIEAIDSLENACVFVYDGNQRLRKTTLAEGNSSTHDYDGDGNLIQTKFKPKPGSDLADRSTTYTYESVWNKVATVTDFDGNTSSYGYVGTSMNGASKVTTVTVPNGSAPAMVTSFDYNANGLVTSTTDPSGLVTTYVYDSAWCLSSVCVDPTGLAITTEFTYDGVGNALTGKDPRGNVTSSQYDLLRREIQVNTAPPFNQIATVTYDPNGNVIASQYLSATDGNSASYAMTYSIDNKLLSAKCTKPNFGDQPQPNSTRFEYDEMRRCYKRIDPAGTVILNLFDALSRSVGTTVNGVPTGSVSYTSNGSAQFVTDAKGNTSTYEYDGFDRPSKVIYPDTSYEELLYDNRDNNISQRFRDGSVISLSYNALNQLSTRTTAGTTTTYSYDSAGRPLSVSTPVIAGDPSTGTFTLVYDSAKRCIGEQLPDGKLVQQLLDLTGNVQGVIYTDGQTTTNSFDALNRITSIQGIGGSVTFKYDSASRRVAQLNGNKTAQAFSYDSTDSLRAMSIGNINVNVSVPTFSKIHFTYGRYDSGDTADRSVNDATMVWKPDAQASVDFGTANEANQLPKMNAVPLTYNGNGCLTADGTRTYAYNGRNQLQTVTTPAGVVQLRYDPFGRLTQKLTPTANIRYIYAGFERIEERDHNNDGLLRRFVYGPGADECLYSVDGSGALLYIHGDERGSKILTTDVNGEPVEKVTYAPWGKATAPLDSGPGFTGQFFDADIGAYFYKTRFYHAELGRFMQPDLIGYAGGANLYEYCASNPIDGLDPRGTSGANGTFILGIQKTGAASYTYTPVSYPMPDISSLLWANFQNVSALNSGGTAVLGGNWILTVWAHDVMMTNAKLAADSRAQAQAFADATQRAMIEQAIARNAKAAMIRSAHFKFLGTIARNIPYLQQASDAAAGFGDASSGGATSQFRDYNGTNQFVNTNGVAYSAGWWGSTALEFSVLGGTFLLDIFAPRIATTKTFGITGKNFGRHNRIPVKQRPSIYNNNDKDIRVGWAWNEEIQSNQFRVSFGKNLGKAARKSEDDWQKYSSHLGLFPITDLHPIP